MTPNSLFKDEKKIVPPPQKKKIILNTHKAELDLYIPYIVLDFTLFSFFNLHFLFVKYISLIL